MNHRDDRGLSALEPDATIDVFSPHTYLRDIDGSGAAIYSYSGWLDGGYTHSAVKRHVNLSGARHRLILGPWDHGGRQHISPMARGRSRFDHVGEVVAFFEQRPPNFQGK